METKNRKSLSFQDLFLSAADHQDPESLAFVADCASGGLRDETNALAELLWFAGVNQDTQINEGVIANAASLFKRLLALDDVYRGIGSDARRAARPHSGGDRTA